MIDIKLLSKTTNCFWEKISEDEYITDDNLLNDYSSNKTRLIISNNHIFLCGKEGTQNLSTWLVNKKYCGMDSAKNKVRAILNLENIVVDNFDLNKILNDFTDIFIENKESTKEIAATILDNKSNKFQIYKNTIGIISGVGGSGKSYLILKWLVDASTNNKNKTFDVLDNKKILYISSEDDMYILNMRIASLCGNNKNTIKKVFKRLKILPLINFPDDNNLFSLHVKELKTGILYKKIQELINEKEYGIIVFDPLTRFLPMGIDENNNMEMVHVITKFQELIQDTDASCLIVHHSTKNQDKARGASAITDCARFVFNLKTVENTENKSIKNLDLICTKSNYNEQINFYYQMSFDDGKCIIENEKL